MKTQHSLPEWCRRSKLSHGLLDSEGTWIGVNSSLCYLLQRSPGELEGRKILEFIAESSRPIFLKAREEVGSGVKPSRCMDIEFRSPDGNRLFTDLFLTRLDDAPGLMMVQAVSVTRHKETQIELVNAKRRIHLTADVAGMGFWEYDFASGIQNWDDGVFRIYGIRREDFSGRWDTYVHPGDLEQAEQALRDTVRRGGSGEQRFRVLRPDGSVRHVHSIFTVERDGAGSPRSLTGVNFDITERVLAKESEERLEASLRVILDNLPIPVITSRTSGAGEITFLNNEFTRLLGYTLEDAPTIEALIALNYPDPLEKARVVARWLDLISQSRENPTPVRGEPFLIRGKDGRFFDFLVNATVVGDTLIFASHDITARKQAEAQILEARQTLERILENLPVAVLVRDMTVPYETRPFLAANRQFTEMLGYTMADMPTIGVWMRLAYPDKAYREMVENWWSDSLEHAAKGAGLIENAEFQLVAKDGSRHEIVFQATLVGSLLVVAMRDVTQQKKTAAALQVAYKTESILRAEAEEAVKMKARFLASVSHEIRTPVSALVNISQSMLHESEKHPLPGEFLEHLESVRAGGQYLNLILTNLLDASATESGHTPVRPSLFYLRDWVEDIGAILEPIARGHSVEIVWELPEDENERFVTDTVRLSQILLNLAQNAVKFSNKPRARVWISVSLEGEGRLRLSVADEGPGIPAERIEGLFREFGQSGEGDAPSIDRGVGLGLAVVRQNTALLGGKISTRARQPCGICFEIELPGMTTTNHAHPDRR